MLQGGRDDGCEYREPYADSRYEAKGQEWASDRSKVVHESLEAVGSTVRAWRNDVG
jgi:hypothetical protein